MDVKESHFQGMKGKSLFTVLIVVTIVLIVLLSFSFLRFGFFFDNSSLWKGYYTLFVRENGRNENLEKLLEKQPFIKTVVSRYSERVSFYDFEGLKVVKLSELGRYLEDIDPRYDRYMKGLPAYFYTEKKGNRWEVFYLKSDVSPLSFYLKLWALLLGRGYQWIVFQFYGILKLLGTIVMIAYAFLTIQYNGIKELSAKLFLFLGTWVWIFSYLYGGFGDIAMFFIAFPVYASLLKKTRSSINHIVNYGWKPEKPLINGGETVFLIISSMVLIALNLISTGDFSLMARLLWSFLSSLVLLGLMAELRWFALSRNEHKLFEPVKILQSSFFERKRVKPEKKIILIGIFTLVIIFSMVFTIVNSVKYFVIPQPMEYGREGGDFSWEKIEKLWENTKKSKIPNISEYVSHRLYQETFGFGEPLSLQDRNSGIYRYQYKFSKNSGRVIESKQRVRIFDKAWLDITLATIMHNTVAEMLKDQGRPVSVVLLSWREWFNRRLYHIQSAFVLIMIVFYLLYYRDIVPYRIAYDFRRLYERTKNLS